MGIGLNTLGMSKNTLWDTAWEHEYKVREGPFSF